MPFDKVVGVCPRNLDDKIVTAGVFLPKHGDYNMGGNVCIMQIKDTCCVFFNQDFHLRRLRMPIQTNMNASDNQTRFVLMLPINFQSGMRCILN